MRAKGHAIGCATAAPQQGPKAAPQAWDVLPASWRDVPGMLDAVVQAATEGHFSRSFLDVRHQVGLAMQLFSAVLLGRMAIHGQAVTPSRISVVRQGDEVLGFALVRALPDPAARPHLELHLVCVVPHARNRGVGEALVRTSAAWLEPGQSLLVTTLSQAHGMKRLLRRLGAHRLGALPSASPSQQALEAFAFGVSAVDHRPDAPWQDWLRPTHAIGRS